MGGDKLNIGIKDYNKLINNKYINKKAKEKRSKDLPLRDLPQYVKEDNLESRLSYNAIKIMEIKYLDRDNTGKIIEDPKRSLYRVARAIASVEKDSDFWTEKFYNTMSKMYFLPAGRILANAGTETKSMYNCYVIGIEDSLEGIGITNLKVMLIHKVGGGTGIDFSPLRPYGSYVKKSKGVASGPLSFLALIDTQTGVINSGNRRGANMGVLLVDHPDILDFIYAKSSLSEYKLENFNLSVGITDEFMNAVKNHTYYTLRFNNKAFKKEDLESLINNIEKNGLAGSSLGKKARKPSLLLSRDKVINRYNGEAIGRINPDNNNVELNAEKVLYTIAKQAWGRGDPGVLFIDTINKDNPFPGTRITATNPCGEQPLLPNEACDLGSINLSKMVDQTKEGYKINYDRLRETIRIAVRMLDNVNDINEGPLQEIEKTTRANRRIGLGVMGLADMLMKLRLPYDSEEGRKKTEDVMEFINREAYNYSIELAKEKGVFDSWEKSIYKERGIKIRNVARTTIAPTGSISMVAGVISAGIEPQYSNVFKKNIRGNKSLIFINEHLIEELKKIGIYSKDLEAKIISNGGSIQNIDEIPEDIKKIYKTALEIDWKDHILMQSVIQKHVDNAVSKTINMPNNASIEDVLEAYMMAYDLGLKGITVYRDGSLEYQVLESKKDKSKVPDILGEIRISKPSKYGRVYSLITYGANKNPLEMFLIVGKSGEDMHAYAEGLGRLISSLLRVGVNPLEIIDQLDGVDGKPNEKSFPSLIGDILKEYMVLKENNFRTENLEDKIREYKTRLNTKIREIREKKDPQKVLPGIKIKQRSPFGDIFVNITYNNKYDPIETFIVLGKSGEDEHANIEALGRLISLYLRNGGNEKDIIKQLKYIGGKNRTISREGTIRSLPDAVGKALEIYVKMREKGLIKKIENGIDASKEIEKIKDEIRNGSQKKIEKTTIKIEKDIKKVNSFEKNDSSAIPVASHTEGCPKGQCGD